MARVRFLQAVAGQTFSWVAGQEVDMPGEEASKWADGIRAELVRGETPETPESARPEKAAAKRSPRAKSTETTTDPAPETA